MNAIQPAIIARNLTQRFVESAGVDDVTLEVRQGEIFGFLGPNEAGKTPIIRMMLGLMPARAGSVTVLGARVAERPAAIRPRVG